MFKLAPSILSADFANLERDIKKIENAGAHYAHIDVMDGHFVPNITIGAPVVRAIKKSTNIALDVHLMISQPDKYIDDFISAGADIITVHFEAEGDTAEQLRRIRQGGCKAAVAVKPKTDVSEIYNLLDLTDMVLVMTVEPGFGGQSLIEGSDKKVKTLYDEMRKCDKICDIEVDGGIKLSNVEQLYKAGANIIVAGSAVFGAEDVGAAVKSFYEKCRL